MPKILHFEDDVYLADMYGTMLQMAGFAYATYPSPSKNPLELVLQEKPDLIIMDIIMPEMDGYDATRLLKADERTKDIPIFGLCNMGQKEDIQKALDFGMVDYYVAADHQPDEIVARVKALLTGQ